MRPTKDQYYMNLAKEVSSRATCLRRKYGAVIVKDDTVIATGYNGSPRGERNCCDKGSCIRQEQKIPAGERYELCCALHAEHNACLEAGRKATIGAKLFLYGQDAKTGTPVEGKPCAMCLRTLKNAGIRKYITLTKEGKIKDNPILFEKWATASRFMGNLDSVS